MGAGPGQNDKPGDLLNSRPEPNADPLPVFDPTIMPQPQPGQTTGNFQPQNFQSPNFRSPATQPGGHPGMSQGVPPGYGRNPSQDAFPPGVDPVYRDNPGRPRGVASSRDS